MELALAENIAGVNKPVIANGIFRENPVRKFKKLRLSITEDCNLRCTYCDRGKASGNSDSDKKNRIEELLFLVKNLHQTAGFESVRITGGEPTLSSDLVKVVYECRNMGIEKVNLTTNGIYLDDKLEDLKRAGISRINVSLDAVNSDVYKRITGSDRLHDVMQSVTNCMKAGIPLKLNSVIMKGINDDQILPILEFGLNQSIPVRFLELMKMGTMYDVHDRYFYPVSGILEKINSRYSTILKGRKRSSTSTEYTIGSYSFGVIANHSEPFCTDCDRLRLDHTGAIYGCLSNSNSFNLKGINGSDYKNILEKAMRDKMDVSFHGSNINMRRIGG